MTNRMRLKIKSDTGSHWYEGPLYSSTKELQAWYERGVKDGFRGKLFDRILIGSECEAYFCGLQTGTAERRRVKP